MKNNNDRIFVIAIVTEILLSVVTLVCLITQYKINSKTIQNVPTTVVVETPIEEIEDPGITYETARYQSTKLMRHISRSRCTYDEAIFIYDEIVRVCSKYEVPVNLAFGIGAQESQFVYNARNKRTKATGLFQICPGCLEDYNSWNGTSYTLEDMYDIEKNIEVGIWNFKQQAYYLRREATVKYSDLIIAYNTGVGNFKKYKDSWYKGWNPIDNVEYKYLNEVVRFSNQFTSALGELF